MSKLASLYIPGAPKTAELAAVGATKVTISKDGSVSIEGGSVTVCAENVTVASTYAVVTGHPAFAGFMGFGGLLVSGI